MWTTTHYPDGSILYESDDEMPLRYLIKSNNEARNDYVGVQHSVYSPDGIARWKEMSYAYIVLQGWNKDWRRLGRDRPGVEAASGQDWPGLVSVVQRTGFGELEFGHYHQPSNASRTEHSFILHADLEHPLIHDLTEHFGLVIPDGCFIQAPGNDTPVRSLADTLLAARA